MADLPLVLFAGPIVRRVEPRLAAVWVAIDKPRSVIVSVFEGRKQTGTGTGVFMGGDPVVRGAVLRALTDAGLVRRIQPSGSVGGGTLERYNGAPIATSRRRAQKWKQGINQVGQMAL